MCLTTWFPVSCTRSQLLSWLPPDPAAVPSKGLSEHVSYSFMERTKIEGERFYSASGTTLGNSL